MKKGTTAHKIRTTYQKKRKHAVSEVKRDINKSWMFLKWLTLLNKKSHNHWITPLNGVGSSNNKTEVIGMSLRMSIKYHTMNHIFKSPKLHWHGQLKITNCKLEWTWLIDMWIAQFQIYNLQSPFICFFPKKSVKF